MIKIPGSTMIEWECLVISPSLRQKEELVELEMALEKASREFEENLTSGDNILAIEKDLDTLRTQCSKFKSMAINLSNYEILEWSDGTHTQGKLNVEVITLNLKDRFGERVEMTIKATKQEFITMLKFFNISYFNLKEIEYILKNRPANLVNLENMSFSTPLDDFLKGESTSTLDMEEEDSDPIF